MMKQLKLYTLVIFSAFFQGAVVGQELLPYHYDSTVVENQIIIEGGFYQHSTSLRNDITRRLLFGGELDPASIDNSLKRHGDYSRLGGEYHTRIEYRAGNQIFSSNPNWSWMINFSNEAHFSAQYSQDLFGLIFKGNESYLSEYVYFNQTYARFDQFMTIGGGFHNKKTKTYVTLNLVLPYNFFNTYISVADGAFSDTGDYMRIKAKGDAYLPQSHTFLKGLGISSNFEVHIPFGDSTSFNGVVGIQGRNIGFYKFVNTDHYTINTEIKYSGFSIQDLMEFDDFSVLLDDTLGITSDKKSVYRLTPGFLQVAKLVSAESKYKVQPFFGVRMYTTKIFRPMIFAGGHYQINNEFSLGAQFSYGGYGPARLGLYFSYRNDNINIGLGTEDILGLILKGQLGHSGLIRFAWNF